MSGDGLVYRPFKAIDRIKVKEAPEIKKSNRNFKAYCGSHECMKSENQDSQFKKMLEIEEVKKFQSECPRCGHCLKWKEQK